MTSGRTLGAVSLFLAGISGCLKPAPGTETPGTPQARQPPLAVAAAQSPSAPVPALTTQPEPVDVAIPSSEYPREALAAKAEGSVVLKILIDDTGRVREAKVVGDPGHGFGEAATRSAIAHFRFSPALVHGRPVAAWWTFTVAYELPVPRPNLTDENCACSRPVNATVQDGLDRGGLEDPYCPCHR
jgi:TonB family protein